jgi:excisionase family DNA binding protein
MSPASFPSGAGRLLYTPTEAAALLSISRSTIYELIARGELASVRIGASRRVAAAALADYVQRLAGPAVDAGADP